MAKIVLSDQAPSGESIHFSIGGVDFDLGGSGKGTKKSYETTDRTVLSNAEATPWLSVEYDEAEQVVYERPDTRVAPEDDAQSILGPNANIPFDPEEIRKVEEQKAEDAGLIPAFDANKDQDKPVVTGDVVAETVAATDDGGDK
jgi:hypothetical protein